LSLAFALNAAAAVSAEETRNTRAEIVAAEVLSNLGLHPGEAIAAIGNPYESYYAHLAQLHLIATIGFRDPFTYDTAQFWKLDDASYHALTQEMWNAGVHAIVSSENCDLAAAKGWLPLGDTNYCVLLAAEPRHP
jgi:hypothetical protein